MEHLNLVSGIEIGYGGVYVGAAPYLLFIPDRDGDDKPDGAPEILLDGWGYQDTHETLNSFIWGPDGWLYGCHGVFTYSSVGAPGTPKEQRVPLNCAYWRFHPVRKTFEIYASGTSNSWGFDCNEYGDWFSEACVIPHFWHIIQGGYYLRQSNPLGHYNPYVYTNIETIADHLHYIGNTPHSGNGVSDAAGGGHAHCGLCIYNGDNFPPEYRGRPMLFNIHGKRINQQLLVPEGSGYVAKAAPDFLKANDANFTGVALKVGPDGALYFIDWYDREKCHRPQPEVWDRSNGRIYRVKYDKTWKPWKPGSPSDLRALFWTDEMASRTGWHARMALKALYETPQDGRHKADAMLRKLSVSFNGTGTDKETRKLTAIEGRIDHPFYFYALGQISGDMEKEALEAMDTWLENDANNRRSTDAVASAIGNLRMPVSTRVLQNLQRLASDGKHEDEPAIQSPRRVRLALASALQRLPLKDRWPIAEALISHGEDVKDHNLPQMYWYAIEPLVPADPDKALELAAKSQIPLVSQNIARRLAEAEGGVPHLIAALGKEKTGAGAVYLMKAALQGLKGRSGETPPKEWDGAYANIDDILKRRADAKDLTAEISDLREALAVSYGDKRAFPRLRQQVKDAALPVERRELALQTLLTGKDPEVRTLIQDLLDDPVMRLPALRALPAALR